MSSTTSSHSEIFNGFHKNYAFFIWLLCVIVFLSCGLPAQMWIETKAGYLILWKWLIYTEAFVVSLIPLLSKTFEKVTKVWCLTKDFVNWTVNFVKTFASFKPYCWAEFRNFFNAINVTIRTKSKKESLARKSFKSSPTARMKHKSVFCSPKMSLM